MISIVAVLPAAAADSVFDARGFNPNRTYFSQLPYEHVDPLTGNLILTHTDLALPGPAGFDLVVQRTYNSKIYGAYHPNGSDTPAEDSWAGLGWTLHYGRLLNALAPTPGPIEMPDGSRHELFAHAAPIPSGCGSCYVTKDFWTYDKNTKQLKPPNGRVYTMGQSVSVNGATAYYTTEVKDPFNNRIAISYFGTSGAPADGISKIDQYIGTQQRTVTFGYDPTWRSLSSMTFSGRTWTYTQAGTDHVGISLLKKVKPPESTADGSTWRYTYNETVQPRYEMSTLTTPHGGTLTYTFSDAVFNFNSSVSVRSRALTQRRTSGWEVPADTITYGYAAGTSKNQTTVTSVSNCDGKTTYTFAGVGTSASGSGAWQVGLETGRTVSSGSTVLETLQTQWLKSVPISNDSVTIGIAQDFGIFVPLVDIRTIARGSSTYTTDYGYATTIFNDYGRPNSIVEAGELSRSTIRNFDYAFTPYIKDKVASETVTVGSESFTRSWQYVDATGFLSSATVYGTTTSYAPHSTGAVASQTDANGGVTSFTNSWGVEQNRTTPEFAITRTVNADGTVASITRRGFTTNFQYDDLGRPTLIDPPVGNSTVVTYDNASGQWTRSTRGTSLVQTELDGFGRTSASTNAVDVQTDTRYDTCGRVAYESLPFDATRGNAGTTFAYDALGRLTTRTNPGTPSSQVQYTYGAGVDVDITDEEQHVTHQNWSAFGDPSDARLMSVTDAAGESWNYTYNAVGSLRTVTPPGQASATRTWVYNTKNQLTSETQPELTSAISYTYYPAGNLKTRTDAWGMTTYNYDGNQRLRHVDRPTAHDQYDTWIDYDASDNRIGVRNSFVTTTFGYDSANRLDFRKDVVAGKTFTTDYQPDANGNIDYIVYPSGQRVDYSYDDASRVTAVSNGGATVYANNFIYHPSGATTSYRAGNGIFHETGFDERYRVDLTSSEAVDIGYRYYDGGNVLAIDDARPGLSQTFTYDDLDRVETVEGWGAGGYTYDALGNRTTSTVGGSNAFTYDAKGARLTSFDGAMQSYDASGNITGDGTQTFTYTPDNLIKTATAAGQTTTYKYDGDGLRTVVEGQATKYFTHGFGNEILSEFQVSCTGAAELVRDYVYAAGRQIAQVTPDVSSATVAVAGPTKSALENGGAVTIGIKLTTGDGSALPCAATVRWAATAGSASVADFGAASGTMTFAAGTASGTIQDVSVTIVNDSLDEADESFSVGLSQVTGASLGSSATSVVIADDDLPPSISIAPTTVTEGPAASASFVAALSTASGKQVSVGYASRSVTAGEGVDYSAASGVLTFAPGLTTATLAVPVLDDPLDEDTESFAVDLSGPTNATLETTSAAASIQDDDGAPTISISDAAIAEGASGASDVLFEVGLSAASGKTVTVSYVTADVVAIAGPDYAAASGSMTFTPGTSALTLRVPVTGDGVDEPNETFTVTLATPSNATIARATGTATIFNDDGACGSGFGVAPATLTFDRMGGSSDIAVSTTPQPCAWQVVAADSWLVVSPATGTGAGVVRVTAQPNGTGRDRVGRVLVQGTLVTVNQVKSEAVSWQNLVNVTATGNSLQKTSGGAAYDAGARSSHYVLAGETAFVEFTAGPTSVARVAGLGTVDEDQTDSDVDFGIRLLASGQYCALQAGTCLYTTPTTTTYNASSRFRVAVEGNNVRYYHNGAVFHSLPAAVTFPLYVDTSFRGLNGSLLDFVLGGRFQANRPPTAEANGPYPASIGAALALSSAGSVDLDGDPLTYAWDFGDGNTGTGPSPSHVYASGGTYTVTLTVSDTGGLAAQDTAVVTASVAPVTEDVVWTKLVNVVATGSTLTKNGGVDLVYDAGGSSTRSITAATDAYVEFTAGAQTSKGRTVGFNDVDNSVSEQEIDYAIQLQTSASFRIIEAGTAVWPTGATTGTYAGSDTFKVRYDSAASQVRYYKNGALLYSSTKAPTFPMVLDASFKHSSGKITAAKISGVFTGTSTNHPPSAEANGPYSGDAGTSISFSAAGSADPDGDSLVYAWSFGDGTTASGASTNHTYANGGTFTVTLTVTDPAGLSSQDTASVGVASVNRAPVAQAGGPYTGTPDVPVAFNAGSSIDPDGDPVAYAWDFGDGTTEVGVSTSHAYAAVGSYTVTVTVTDPNGLADQDTVAVTIAPPNQAPLAEANGPYTGNSAQAIAFSSAGSVDPDGGTLSYTWTFGDGTSSTAPNPSHSYTTAGTYTATLAVTDSAGGMASDAAEVTVMAVNRPPVAEANGPYAGTVNATIAFSEVGSNDPDGDALTYSWAFGDGSTGSGPAPSHAYATAGTYTLTLTVTDPAGLTSQDTATVTVSPGTVVENIVWTRTTNVTVSGNSITKSAGVDLVWNAGASSTKAITSAADGYVEFSVGGQTTRPRAFGLNDVDGAVTETEIDYSMQALDNGVLKIAEAGTVVFTGTYTGTDTLRVSFDKASGKIQYLQNGGLIYTSLQTPSFPLIADSSIKKTNGTISNAKISGVLQ